MGPRNRRPKAKSPAPPPPRRLDPPAVMADYAYDTPFITDATPPTTDEEFIRGEGFDSSSNESASYSPRRRARQSPARRLPTPSRTVASPLRPRQRQGSLKPPSSTPKRPRPRDRPQRRSVSPAPGPKTLLADTANGSLAFALDILSKALWMIRVPLTWLFAAYLIVVVLSIGYRYATRTVFTALAPICSLPGVFRLDLPFCIDAAPGQRAATNNAKEARFPELIEVQTHFSGVLEESVSGSTLALDLKNSEVAVRDLNTLVRVSDLLCKDELSIRLEDFVASAKSTSRGLTRFGSRVGGVVDSLLAMDEYAIRSLEAADARRTIGATESFTDLLLYPFRPTYDVDRAKTEVLQTFIQASQVMDTSIRRLVVDATAVLADLDDLENQLTVVDEMVSRENNAIKADHEEVLAQLWTILGGNRQKIKNFSNHQELLRGISSYRSRALGHVSASLLQLQQMQSDLEELRDRVAAPALMEHAGKTGEVPLEVQIHSIRKGVERLSDGMTKAKRKEGEYMRGLLRGAEQAERASIADVQSSRSSS